MKNHSYTQERSPVTDTSTSRRPQPLLVSHPWLIVVGVGLLSMAIATVAIFSLTSTGRVEKDPAKQTTIATQTQTPPASRRGGDVSINWWLLIGLLGAGAASVVAVYKWQHLSNSKRGLTRRQQRKLRQQSTEVKIPLVETEIAAENAPSNANNLNAPELIEQEQLIEPILMDVTPTIVVLSPEAERKNDADGQSLAEMMDIRKHLSLAEILQDFKRPN